MACDELVRLFPSSEREVPERFRIAGRVEQREYLVGGEIRSWSGESQEVLSPVLERSGDELRPRPVGSYPLLGEAEARAAISAAAAAYDNGRGRWPPAPSWSTPAAASAPGRSSARRCSVRWAGRPG